jgi:predicted kinase
MSMGMGMGMSMPLPISPALLLVSGPPGAGKTTIARRLAADLQLPLFAKDDLKELLFDTLGWSDRAWSRRMGIASIKLLYRLAEIELAAGRAVILESNFRPAFDDEQFQALQSRYLFRPVQIYCIAETETLVRRVSARAASSERHPGHVEETWLDDFAAGIRADGFGPLALDGPVHILDTTDFAAVDYPALLAAVRASLSAS